MLRCIFNYCQRVLIPSRLSEFFGGLCVGVVIEQLSCVRNDSEELLLPSLCLFFRIEQLGSHWTDIHEILYLRIFRTSVENI